MKNVTNYSCSLPSHPQFNEWKRNIILFNGTQAIVDVRFVENPGSSSLQSLVKVDPNGISMVYVRFEDYPLWVDILRNEKPVYVHHYPESKRILLSTFQEPVGETEQ